MPAKTKRDSRDNGDAAQKRKRQEGVENLTAQYLSKAQSSQLLSRLLECHNVLDGLAAPFQVDKDFLNEVLKKEYCANPNPDVQIITACIISDAMRLAEPIMPFPDAKAADVVRLFCVALQRLKAKKSDYAIYARHVIERLAACHAFALLTAKATEVDGDLDDLFQTLMFEADADDDAMISHMAQLVVDIISGTQTVTDVQLTLMLAAVTPSHKEAKPTGYKVAAAAFHRKDDFLQAAVSSSISNQLEDAAEELRQIDLSDGEMSERKAALKKIVRATTSMVQLSSISINLVTQVVPAVAVHLGSDHNDLRLVITRSFARAFIEVPALMTNFTPTYHTFLGRFSDPRQLVRMELVKFASSLLLQQIDNDQNWAILSPALTNRLIDSDESVRKATVMCICDVAEKNPQRVPRRLVEKLGDRCADKKPGVRNLAVTKLCSLYRLDPNHFDWIPDAIFRLSHADVGISVVEFALSSMLPLSAAATKPLKRALSDMPVFDFEQTGSAAVDSTSFATFFANLVGSLSKGNRAILMSLMGKKAQLRLTVRRLFELRKEIQEKKDDAQARDQLANMIRRLLTFLQDITHAEKDEWHTIFKEIRDERIVKSILNLCAADCTDFQTATVDVTTKMQGRVNAQISKFFTENLLQRLSLPFSAAHVNELVELIEKERRGSKNITKLAKLLRALAAMGKMAPQLLPAHAGKLVKWVKEDSELFSKSTDENAGAVTQATLEVFSLIDQATEDGKEVPKVILEHSKAMISTIGRICIHNVNGQVAKGAARCLATLYRRSSNAFSQLLTTLLEKLAAATKESASNFPPQIVSWLKTVAVIATAVPNELAAFSEAYVETISNVLLLAVRTANVKDGDTLDAKSKKLGGPLLEVPCFLASVTDAAAKALTAYVRSLPSNRQPMALKECYDTFFTAFKSIGGIGMSSVGGCLKRLALDKQLAKLLLIPSNDLSRELTAAIFLSAEDNSDVRGVIQRKLHHHFTTVHPQPDMRYLSFLLLTAMAEDSRNGFNGLKGLVHQICEKLRDQQSNSGASLSDLPGLKVFAEYCIPFVVFYTAHHAAYDVEAQSNFIGFQRVWHLLLDELLKNNTGAASFIVEMFRKLKSHDDLLNPDSNKTRVMCDLGSKVLLEIMSSKSASLDTMKQFPGSVLLPAFFTASDGGRFPADIVYLDPSIPVYAHPPFKTTMVSATPARSVPQPVEGATPAADGVAADVEEDDEGVVEDGDEETINNAIGEIVEGLTAEQIGTLSWSKAEKHIESKLKKKLNPETTRIAYAAVRAAHAAASEE